jgi:hypothetical protein
MLLDRSSSTLSLLSVFPLVVSSPRNNADRSHSILSQILHFSLLRFVFDPETFNRKKSKSTIRFPPSINMGSFIAGSDKREDAWYDLRGVLLHKGGSAYSGHYCAEIYEEQ